jgi:hypothetical protein
MPDPVKTTCSFSIRVATRDVFIPPRCSRAIRGPDLGVDTVVGRACSPDSDASISSYAVSVMPDVNGIFYG